MSGGRRRAVASLCPAQRRLSPPRGSDVAVVPPNGGKPLPELYLPASRVRTVMRMTATAILFPGQGSQTPEMRETVDEQRPDLLERVELLLGSDPFAAGR